MYTDILVVGGGIAGITASLESAEIGSNVTVVDKNTYLGGRVAQFNKYFPKLCPPQCGLEILLARAKKLKNFNYYTGAEVKGITRKDGRYVTRILVHPRYINDRCTACGKCVEVCPVSRPNDFNMGMDSTKAVYLPHKNAFPYIYAIDEKHCKGVECSKCLDACSYGAIDLSEKERELEIESNAVIMATGWNPYDAQRLNYLGFGAFDNVITNLMMERLSSPSGPTGGKILRRSDGKEPRRVAFVQCAGSRDENNLKYCSQVCCLASMKQARYIRNQYPDAEIEIFYIDLRAYGLYEHFLSDIQKDEKITFVRGKVSRIDEFSDKSLRVQAEDTLTGIKVSREFDLVVLATGMEPSSISLRVEGVDYDTSGFVADDGVISCGVATRPEDVRQSNQDAEGAAMDAILAVKGKGESI